MNEDFFGNLKQTLTETADVVTKKTEQLVESQKLKGKISSVRRSIDECYRQLGEKVYSRFVDGEAMDEVLAGFCDKIAESYKEMETYKKDLAEKKGQCICPECGAGNPINAAYCMSCGKEIVKETPKEDTFQEDIFEEEDGFPKEADEMEAEELEQDAVEEVIEEQGKEE